MSTRIIVTSWALGEPTRVHVVIHHTLDAMRRAADAFAGTPGQHAEALGVTHAWTDDTGRAGKVLVRLVCDYLGTRIVSHEMHHATTALYGARLGERISRAAHLNHHNEEFAYLYSDLLGDLVERLHARGYYDQGDGSCD